MPNLIAYDICGVQPMTGPTGLIFAMRARFASMDGDEALGDEADSGFSNDDAAGDLTSSAMTGSNPNYTKRFAICWYILITNWYVYCSR